MSCGMMWVYFSVCTGLSTLTMECVVLVAYCVNVCVRACICVCGSYYTMWWWDQWVKTFQTIYLYEKVFLSVGVANLLRVFQFSITDSQMLHLNSRSQWEIFFFSFHCNFFIYFIFGVWLEAYKWDLGFGCHCQIWG